MYISHKISKQILLYLLLNLNNPNLIPHRINPQKIGFLWPRSNIPPLRFKNDKHSPLRHFHLHNVNIIPKHNKERVIGRCPKHLERKGGKESI